MSLEENRKLRKPALPMEEALDRLASERHQSTSSEGDVQKMDEKDQYTYYYDRIYPLLKEGRLDYNRIANKTEFKERRIRETLLFRLTSGEVMQLFGRKEGYCYICKKRLTALKSTEPLCLACLQAIDTAAQESHMSSLLSLESGSKRITPDTKVQENTHPSLLAEPEIPSLSSSTGPQPLDAAGEPISREQYNSLLAELNYYKAQAQQGRDDVIPMQTKPQQEANGNAGNTADGKKPADKSPLAVASSDLLAILDMKEEELSTENYWEPEGTNDTSQPLRQFGFQRLKSAGNERGGKW